MEQTDKTEDKADGRRLRGQENRRRIVEAMLHLVREGVISPSAEEVSARANVGLRTVFRHFDDMDSLYRELSERMLAEIDPIATAPLPQGSWPERLEAMVERRATVFEKIMPFMIAADVHKHRSAFLREDHASLARLQREMLSAALPENLKQDPIRLEALDLLLSFDSWRRLRQEQGLTPEKAKEIILAAALALGTGSSSD